jgi:hypothetical protein
VDGGDSIAPVPGSSVEDGGGKGLSVQSVQRENGSWPALWNHL